MPQYSDPARLLPDASTGQPLSPRRHQLVEAALHVVAEHGLRGLTHRAVDRRAGLPEGSCSAYLRTRRALQAALTEHVAGTLARDVDMLTEDLRAHAPGDDRGVELTGRLFRRWLDERELLLARVELSLEASRDPELAALLASWRARLVAAVAGLLAARGRARSDVVAEALVASFDGILFAALLKPDDARRAFLERSLDLLMGAFSDPSRS
jgi:DNA-binding transcriptional regulator YbjK